MYLNAHQHRESVPLGGFRDISLDKAELVAIALESFIYGIEAMTFVATVYLLHGTKHSRAMVFKFGLVITMFLLNTIHLGSSLRRILNAFVGTPTDPVPDAEAYLADLAGFLYRFMNILTVIQFIILDVVVVYRCYMIWDRKLVVTIVPSLGVIAFLVTGIAAIHAFANDTVDTVFTGVTRTWFSAMLCITLFTKLVCFATVLAGTYMRRPMSPWHSIYLQHLVLKRLVTKAFLIGIESGGLAVLGAVILIPVYLSGRNAQGIMLAAMSPLTGQSFLLIIMAALLGFTPSTTGVSRRRKFAGIPNNRVSLPPISISPMTSPTSRFSTGSIVKSKGPSSYLTTSPNSDYNTKPITFKKVSGPPASAPTPAPTPTPSTKTAFTVASVRGYEREEPMPFSSYVPREPSLSLDASSRETLPYGGDGDSLHISVSSRQEVNTIPNPQQVSAARMGTE